MQISAFTAGISCLILSNFFSLYSVKMARDLRSFKVTHLVDGAQNSFLLPKIMVIPVGKGKG